MESKDTEDHFLSLKVMRLTKPTLKSPPIITTDLKDLPGDLLNNAMTNHPACISECNTLNVGRLMMIPQSFGNIYLGEVFSCYMFAHNDSIQDTAKNVYVKADLQTTSKRLPLTDGQQPVSTLPPNATVDRVINHEVKEIGTHILICEVHYQDEAGKNFLLKKFYKFQVLKPLDIQTKFYNAEDYISDEVFLEAQIQNLTMGPINLEKVTLEPSLPFKVQSMTSGVDPQPGCGMLQPQASRQFIYCLAPASRNQENLAAKNIGILDIVWRSNLGERGHLQTCDLQRMPPDYGDIRLTVTDIPNIVKLEDPFTFTCKLSNLSNRSMELILSLEKVHHNLTWIGTSGRKIGALKPSGSIDLSFTMVPLAAGLHSISGIRIRDETANKLHEYDDLTQIFVT